jgi:hypothetical protein
MLYRLEPILFSPYAIIDMERFNKKYYEYFIQNTGDGKFLNYITISFKAQEDYNQNNIIKEDFLSCSTPIPIFSERFVNCLKNDLIDEMDFIKCCVKCNEKIFEYYIGKIKKTKELVDKENSEYRELRDGSKVIHSMKYHKNIKEDDFIIARDTINIFVFLVNDRFKELIEKNNINIKLKKIE